MANNQAQAPAGAQNKQEGARDEDIGKSKSTDAKQSFVEQVSEGLLKKVPADRIESDISGKITDTPATQDDSKGEEKAVSPPEETKKESDAAKI